MNNEEKLRVFQKHLNMIQSTTIKSFTKYCIIKFPNYIWTLPASTSGRRHGGNDETLIDHIQACLFMAEAVIDQFEKHWTQRQKDQLISSVLLHDCMRAGLPGQELRYDEETIKKRNMPMEKLGTIRTHPEHAEIGYRQVLKWAAEYNREATYQISAKDLSMISKAVRYHYGPWLDITDRPFSLSWPYDSVVIQMHTIDYHNAKNAVWYNKRRKK